MTDRLSELYEILLVVLPDGRPNEIIKKEQSNSCYIPPESRDECWLSLARRLSMLPQFPEDVAVIRLFNYFSDLEKKDRAEKRAHAALKT